MVAKMEDDVAAEEQAAAEPEGVFGSTFRPAAPAEVAPEPEPEPEPEPAAAAEPTAEAEEGALHL